VNRSEESKLKTSLSLKGRHTSPTSEFKKGHEGYWLGKHFTVEHSLKIGNGISKFYQSHPAQHRKSPSEETRKLLSLVSLQRWENPQYREMQCNACKGEKCYLWRGGCYEPYSEDFNEELKEQIRDRDNYTCQLCGIPECECVEKLHVHHRDNNKKNDEPYNLISLCRSCHSKASHDPAKIMGIDVANIAKVKGVA